MHASPHHLSQHHLIHSIIPQTPWIHGWRYGPRPPEPGLIHWAPRRSSPSSRGSQAHGAMAFACLLCGWPISPRVPVAVGCTLLGAGGPL
ncbi:hypothetical protein G7046_g7637 [Stylonectria norvegica]|nr:hypothetical protein G7046_g7637 [Stylonectria norvegica]